MFLSKVLDFVVVIALVLVLVCLVLFSVTYIFKHDINVFAHTHKNVFCWSKRYRLCCHIALVLVVLVCLVLLPKP